MKNLPCWKTFALTIAWVLISGPLSWADFRLGEDAYLAQDYETAMREWAPLAAQGNAEAQNMVGYMYRWGQGVAQDFETARYWYRLAADQGHQSAQNNLGLLYRYGLLETESFSHYNTVSGPFGLQALAKASAFSI